MRISLRLKLILSQILPILIILPLFAFYLTATLRTYYINQLKAGMLQTGELVTDALQTNAALANDPNGLQELLQRVDQQTAMRIQIIDKHGIILASTESADAGRIGTISQENSIKSALAGKTSYETSKTDVATVTIPVTSAGDIGAVRLSLQLADVATTFNHINWVVGMGILAIALASLVTSYFLGSTLSRSLRQLSYEARLIAKGDYSQHVHANGNIEVANLASYFNEMVDRLTEQRSMRQKLLDDIAHELHQPISSLHAAIEVVQGASENLPKPIQHLQDALMGEMERLGRLTESLKVVAESGLEPVVYKQTQVDIFTIVNRIVQLNEPKAQQLGIRLISKLPDNLPQVNANKDALVEIFSNLVDNALKYTPGGGQVIVTAGKTQERLWIRVSDTGMDLTQEEQKKLFERFYRGDKAGPRPEGLGLGLAITHELVKAHGGNILVSSAPDRGTTFLVELPI
jgi:signal transduction histidine kinase